MTFLTWLILFGFINFLYWFHRELKRIKKRLENELANLRKSNADFFEHLEHLRNNEAFYIDNQKQIRRLCARFLE